MGFLLRKKYVFETKKTRFQRIIQRLVFAVLVFMFIFTVLCIYIPIFAQKQNEIYQQAFFQKAPDVIAVFTGDQGRIEKALELATRYPSSQVYISGVGAQNSLRTLLKSRKIPISMEKFLEKESYHITLDYQSRNTVENTLSTLKFLREHPDSHDIVIISSDYHLYRIFLLFQSLDKNDDHTFYFHAIENSYFNSSNLIKLTKEVWKLIKTGLFLIFWE